MAKERESYYLRLQPYEGTPLAEVVAWLNSMDKRDANKKIEDVLVMAFLAYARQHSGQYDAGQLRLTCLECCDTGDKHFSTLRQALMVEQPKFSSMLPAWGYPAPVNGPQVGQPLQPPPDSESEKEEAVTELELSRPIKGTAEEVDNLFGDD